MQSKVKVFSSFDFIKFEILILPGNILDFALGSRGPSTVTLIALL